jgi:hypothetical protein
MRTTFLAGVHRPVTGTLGVPRVRRLRSAFTGREAEVLFGPQFRGGSWSEDTQVASASVHAYRGPLTGQEVRGVSRAPVAATRARAALWPSSWFAHPPLHVAHTAAPLPEDSDDSSATICGAAAIVGLIAAISLLWFGLVVGPLPVLSTVILQVGCAVATGAAGLGLAKEPRAASERVNGAPRVALP